MSVTVDVLVDGKRMSGPLSYYSTSPAPKPGTAVEVPYGASTRTGMVLGPSHSKKATRFILRTLGTRATETDINLAKKIAQYHLVSPYIVYPRLWPANARSDNPEPSQKVQLTAQPTKIPNILIGKQLWIPPPTNTGYTQAVAAAAQLANKGQVLIICPTNAAVSTIESMFVSGAVRLDSHAPAHAWKSFSTGTMPVAIGTRTAVLYAAQNLAGIIVLDCENRALRSPARPKTHARDLAIAKARQLKIPLILISTYPYAQSLHGSTVTELSGTKPIFKIMRSSSESSMGWLRKQAQNSDLVVISPFFSAQTLCTQCRRPVTGLVCQCGSEQTFTTGSDPETFVRKFNAHHVITPHDAKSGFDESTVVIAFSEFMLTSPTWFPETELAQLVAKLPKTVKNVVFLDPPEPGPGFEIIYELVNKSTLIPSSLRGKTLAYNNALPPYGRLVTVYWPRKSRPSTAGIPGRILGLNYDGKQWTTQIILPTAKLADLKKVLPSTAIVDVT